MKVHLDAFRKLGGNPAGYQYLVSATNQTTGTVDVAVITYSTARKLRGPVIVSLEATDRTSRPTGRKYDHPRKPVSHAQWPRWVLQVASIRDATDVGPGDTILRITTTTGIKAAVKVYSWLSGRTCKCPERQQRLNELYPYSRIP